ncbi:MAG: hypothetical protein NZP72_14960 [Geminicoccaceae bacterium]|nr:hypothetical protein [Geminicoccaceae bacterium]
MLALEDRFGASFPETLVNRRTFRSIAALLDAPSGLVRERSEP